MLNKTILPVHQLSLTANKDGQIDILSSTTSFSSVIILWSQRNFVLRHCRKSTLAIKASNSVVKVSSVVWWPGIVKHVEFFIKSCPECLKTTPTPTQPLLQVPLPNYPWERIAADLFELKKTSYLLVVDYYSWFVEVQKLTSTTSSSTIVALKAIFFRHGIPSIL